MTLIFAQENSNQVLRDFINWRVDQTVDANCQDYRYIHIDKELIDWQSEQDFVDNYLRDLDSSEINQLIIKHKPSREKYEELKLMLHSDDYPSFSAQLSSSELTWMPEFKKIKCSKGLKSSATFRFSKPLISLDQKVILITEELANDKIICWNRKIVAYMKTDDTWNEALIFNQRSLCQ